MSIPTADVYHRDEFRCFRCGANVIAAPRSIHHRMLKSGGGKDDMVNLITLCGSGTTGCHGAVHGSRTPGNTDYGVKQARHEGFIVSRYQLPEHMPVKHWRQGYVFLYPDGGMVQATAQEVEATQNG